MNENADLDLVVFGASGFTGRMVAEHLLERYGAYGPLRWALGGRSASRLSQVRDEIGAPRDLPLVIADTDDLASLREMVRLTKAVITTVGPYTRYGSNLVTACADSGADYLDLCGETAWIRTMIDTHHERARITGARLMVSCGYDAIPAELGVWFCQETARKELGAAVPLVKGRHRAFVGGGTSGGSWATGLAIAEAVKENPSLLTLVNDPFALTPGFAGPSQPLSREPQDDPDVGRVLPFVLGTINTHIVHRSNMLMDFPYGAGFVYNDMMVADMEGLGDIAMNLSDGSVPAGYEGPAPGEGPNRELLASGYFDSLFIGIGDDGRKVQVAVKGDHDPGYEGTAKIVAEAAICLINTPDIEGGLWTPGAALQGRLVDRLQQHAGVSFEREVLRTASTCNSAIEAGQRRCTTNE